MTLKESYRGTWTKSAYLEKLVIREIKFQFPALSIETGKGAGQDIEIDEEGFEIGSPDLYVKFRQTDICEIEVTGSDKLVPAILWIGAHKVRYIRTLEQPENYGILLFYGRNHQVRYFMSGDMVLSLTEGEAQDREIRGNIEQYYLIPSEYFKGERGFWEWLRLRLEMNAIL